ncbi:MAG TPA: DsbA family protein [Anaerolineae bacterium]|nr:DsbA family protein [Anaerolineae bacterium]
MEENQERESNNTQPNSSNASNPIWLALIFLVLFSGGIGWLIGKSSSTGSEPQAVAGINTPVATAETEPTITQSSPKPTTVPAEPVAVAPAMGPTPVTLQGETITAMGDPNAPVTIVEFSDYQCPFCLRHFQQTMPALKRDYIDTGRVYYVFKDFPIPSLHPIAPRVHEAALCAGEIGGQEIYWQVHDRLFLTQQEWGSKSGVGLDDILVSLIAAEGVAEADLQECLASGHNAALVQADMAEGRGLRVSGTPSFFVNGYPVVGAQPYQVFQQVIALAEEGRLAEAFTQQTGPNDGKAQATATAMAARPADVPLGDAPIKGDVDAPITIVEYSDYQCPFCLRHFQQTLPLLQEYIDNGQVRYVFKDFPIHSIHPEAQKAHESARCAREIGGEDAYWDMHDLIFAGQNVWGKNRNHVTIFKSYATQMALDQNEFDSCLDSGRYAQAVNADLREGQQLGVTGTPAFFINGQRLAGAQPFAVFQQMIETLLSASE